MQSTGIATPCPFVCMRTEARTRCTMHCMYTRRLGDATKRGSLAWRKDSDMLTRYLSLSKAGDSSRSLAISAEVCDLFFVRQSTSVSISRMSYLTSQDTHADRRRQTRDKKYLRLPETEVPSRPSKSLVQHPHQGHGRTYLSYRHLHRSREQTDRIEEEKLSHVSEKGTERRLPTRCTCTATEGLAVLRIVSSLVGEMFGWCIFGAEPERDLRFFDWPGGDGSKPVRAALIRGVPLRRAMPPKSCLFSLKKKGRNERTNLSGSLSVAWCRQTSPRSLTTRVGLFHESSLHSTWGCTYIRLADWLHIPWYTRIETLARTFVCFFLLHLPRTNTTKDSREKRRLVSVQIILGMRREKEQRRMQKISYPRQTNTPRCRIHPTPVSPLQPSVRQAPQTYVKHILNS